MQYSTRILFFKQTPPLLPRQATGKMSALAVCASALLFFASQHLKKTLLVKRKTKMNNYGDITAHL